MLKTGDRAPGFTLTSGKTGQPFSLSKTLGAGYHVLLIFLRHMA